jgi:hypothetical protein
MSRPDPDDRPDDLTERYRAASAQDPARPSDALRQSIFAQARRVAADQTIERTVSRGTRPRAANDPGWRLAIAASVIVTGLATVLAWHFHARNPVPGQRPGAASSNIGADNRLAAGGPVNGPLSASEPAPTESKASTAPAPNAVTARSRQRLVAQAEGPYTAHNGQPSASKPEAASVASSREALARVEVTAEKSADLARNAQAASSESENPISPDQTAAALAAPATPPSSLEARRSAAPAAAASDRPKAQPAPPLIKAAESGDLGQIEQLLRGGASPGQADARGRTALLIATLRADLPMVRRLLAAGARVDAADANGDTPLAAARRQGSPELIHLLERGTQP